MSALRLAIAIGCVLSVGCASAGGPQREQWKAEWNVRADAARSLDDNPCGDFVFDACADEFLVGCSTAGSRRIDCDARTDWVWERSRQCSAWQDWLLRNHQQHERRDDLEEPDVRVP